MKKFFSVITAVFIASSMMAATVMTCSEAATAALSVTGNNVEYNSGEEIEVTGYVTNIAFAWKEGTMTFWMADTQDGGNVLEAYKCAIAEETNAPKVTDKVKVTGKLTKYNTTPEFAEGCTCVIVEVGEGPAVVDINVTNCATAREAALSVASNNVFYKDGQDFTVEGYVTSIATPWAGGSMTFWMADAIEDGNVLEAYKCAIANQADAPTVGDKVSVTGKLTKYNTTPEFAEGCTCVVLQKSDVAVNLGAKTIAEFLALKNRKDTCILTGTVKNIKNTVYGNFDLEDATGSVYIYGLLTPEGVSKQFASMGINEGDEISVLAVYGEYNGAPQAANAILYESASVEDADVVFTSAEFNGQGTANTGSEVTVTKDGVTFWCDKAYGDQYGVRCYKGSKVKISATKQIGKLVFEFNLGYTGGLDETVVVNANEWEYEFSQSQARFAKIKVYFGTAEEIVIEPITVAEALTVAQGLSPEKGKSLSTTETYAVKGFVVGSSSKYENTYYLADETGVYGEFQAFKCKSVDYEVAEGDLVIVTGKIQHYYGEGSKGEYHTYEISNGDLKHVYGQGVENVTLGEKAQKVMVDGVLYIIRDNKLYNLQGAQVR